MTRMKIRSRIGPDGVLNVTVPVGPEGANQDVIITVESAGPATALDRDEWRRAVESTAGSIQDPTFVRHEQGEYELREEWQ